MSAAIKVGATSLWRPGQVKPNGIPRIDWTHPLARGLCLYVFDTGLGFIVDLVQGWPFSYAQTGTPPTPPLGGVSAFGTGINYYSDDPTFAIINSWYSSDTNFSSPPSVEAGSGSPPYTIACAFPSYTPGANDSPFSRITSGATGLNWAITDSGSGGGVCFSINSGGTQFFVGQTALANSGAFTTAVGVANSSSSASFWLNASLEATTTGLTIQNNNANDQIFIAPQWNQLIFYCAFWNRALNQAEQLQLHYDPYCFLLPQNYSGVTGMAASVLATLVGSQQLIFM